MPILDITVPITPSMVRWPGDPPVVIGAEKSVQADGYALTRISLGSHTGTHIDAPAHVVPDGLPVDRIPLETLIGKAYVLEATPQEGNALLATDLVALGIPRDVERILFKTTNSSLWESGPHEFETHYVHLGKRAAHWLADRGVKLVGIDYLSVDPFPSADAPAHHALLSAGVVILEGLNLSRVSPGVYQLVALPLKAGLSDGAPVRAVLIR